MSVKYHVSEILFPSSSLLLFAETITHLQRGLSAIAEHLVLNLLLNELNC